MSRPAPRRPSRTTTPKPRKIAGRVDAPIDVPLDAPGDAPDDAAVPPAAPPQTTTPAPKLTKPAKPAMPSAPPETVDGDEPKASALNSSGATRALLVVVGLFVLLLVLQGVWFFRHDQRNDDHPSAGASSQPTDGASSDGPIAVPSGRPVILNEAAVQDGVDAAASAAQIMFARNWKTYDDGVDDAVKLMTDDFAKEYRSTTDDVRKEFIAKKTNVEVRVVAQSVVRANADELQALIFLNQYIIRGEGKDAKTTYTPYRALLTMVHTDTGWLVDHLDTK